MRAANWVANWVMSSWAAKRRQTPLGRLTRCTHSARDDRETLACPAHGPDHRADGVCVPAKVATPEQALAEVTAGHVQDGVDLGHGFRRGGVDRGPQLRVQISPRPFDGAVRLQISMARCIARPSQLSVGMQSSPAWMIPSGVPSTTATATLAAMSLGRPDAVGVMADWDSIWPWPWPAGAVRRTECRWGQCAWPRRYCCSLHCPGQTREAECPVAGWPRPRRAVYPPAQTPRPDRQIYFCQAINWASTVRSPPQSIRVRVVSRANSVSSVLLALA